MDTIKLTQKRTGSIILSLTLDSHHSLQQSCTETNRNYLDSCNKLKTATKLMQDLPADSFPSTLPISDEYINRMDRFLTSTFDLNEQVSCLLREQTTTLVHITSVFKKNLGEAVTLTEDFLERAQRIEHLLKETLINCC